MKEEEIFHQVLQEKVENRPAFLEAACGADIDLRQRILVLLNAQENPGSFLEQPVFGAADLPTLDQPIVDRIGSQIGPYKLLEEIGEGGMGTVYMAEQKKPVRRCVALKIVKAGMDSRQVLARFDAERQAMAMMDHSSIAKIFDAGTTELGRPYFVMELVRGIPINEFCDQNRLTVRERLELFVKVCQAVQHAHQKGIIHRDLKPSNVLVTKLDVVAVPKIIDFGIAKAFGSQLTDHTQVTGFAQFLGTPQYMSPEQAEMNQLGVDTRSDVYSLGVMLYELLTGNTPFDKEMFKKENFEALRRVLREDDPLRPSARISTLDARALSTVAERRCADPRRITTDIRGELDWIVMKAMEKDRERRYDSANALAADVQRYLNDETVQACPPSTAYRFQKFARKNKTAIATSILVAVVLCIGIGVSSWQAVRATLAEAKADLQLKLARKSDLEAQRQASEAIHQQTLVLERERTLRKYLYASDMKLAWSIFKNASQCRHLDQVRNLLARYEASTSQDDVRSFAWHFMKRLCPETVSTTLYRHDGKAYHVAISPNGEALASVGQDGAARLWDLSTGQMRHTLLGHSGEVNCCAFAPDGKTLATASDDMSVKFWDVDSGQEKFAPKLLGLSMPVHRAEFCSDGKRLVTSELSVKQDSARTIIWDLSSGRKQRELDGHFSLAVSPDGSTIATTSWDNEVRLRDIISGQERIVLHGHDRTVLTAMFSLDGQQLATGDEEGTRIWNLDLKKQTISNSTSNMSVHSVAWSPNHELLAMAYENGETHLWEPKNRYLLRAFKSGLRVRAVRFTPDGNKLASASDDGTIRLIDSSAAYDQESPPDQRGIISSICFSPDGELLATTNDQNEARLWSVATGKPKAFPLHQSDQGVCCMAFSPIGSTLAIFRSDGTINLVDAHTGKQRFAIAGPHANPIGRSLIFSPDGEMLAGSFNHGAIRFWDTRVGKELYAVPHPDYYYKSFAFSPDGKTLAMKKGDFVQRLDVTTWQLLAHDTRHSGEVQCLSYSPDNQHLAIGTSKQIEFWDTTTQQQAAILPGHIGDVTSMAFAPDGRILASGSHNGEVQLWDIATNQELLSLAGHTGKVSCMAFSPDGRTLASASAKPDGYSEIRFWRTSIGTSKD